MTRAWLLVVLAACGSGGTASAPAPAPAKAGVGSGSGSGSGSASAAKPKQARKKPTPATAEQKAAFKTHMKAGWALQQAKKWADAVPEFEAALVAIPAEQRALAELGWSAMNAGDFKKAREADEQAVAIATEPKVKASALFNLGTVQEKSGDKAGALKSYVASLALRPNKVVEQAVGKLGADPKQVADAPACTPGLAPCACLAEIELDDAKADLRCEEETGGPKVAGFKTLTVSVPHGNHDYLFDDAGHFVTEVAEYYDHSETAIEDALDKLERRKVGAHELLWITETLVSDEIEYADNGDETRVETTGTLVTICVIGKETKCPLEDVPQTRTVVRGTVKTAHELAIDVAADGTATIKLVGGAANEQVDALVGPHKLW